MQGQRDRVVAVDLARDAVFRGQIFPLFHEGAEQSIPDNEGAAEIAVDVFRVATVMHTMM